MDIKFSELKRKSNDFEKFKSLYHSAFPAYEQIPVWILFRRAKSENILFYSVYDNETWIGFVYLIIDGDLLFLQYLAVDDSVRSKGYGGAILSKLKADFSEYRIFFAIEMPDEKAENNAQRIKRKEFYEKHGFREAGYAVENPNVVTFEILLHGNAIVSDDFRKVMGKLWGKFIWTIMKKFMKIHEKSNA